MKVIKTYIFIILPIVLITVISCNGVDQSATISISHNIINGKIKLDDTLKIKVNFLKTKSFKNNDLLFDLKSNNNNYELKPSFYNKETNEYYFLLNEFTLGKKELKISLNNIFERLNFTVLNDVRPVIYNYEIINIFNRKRNNYTQGFEFYNDTLYESVGQYGKSKLIKVDFKNGKHLKELKLPAKYFAEGITILNDKSTFINLERKGWICL
jgi:glutaminyl-peptide cyclotransferase